MLCTDFFDQVALNVPRDATAPDIKKAYRRQALVWHPDKNVRAERGDAVGPLAGLEYRAVYGTVRYGTAVQQYVDTWRFHRRGAVTSATC